ncbi:MAG: DUF2231 domain-containing protein [Polyangiales bacterium]
MDQLLFHPKVVHLPIALAVLMPLLSGGVILGWWRGWFDRRVWVLVFALQAVLVGSGVLAMNTGEREEERIEEVVAERYIEAHEEAAEAFVWASAALLVLMAGPLVLKEGRARQAVSLGAFLGTLLVFGLGFKAGEAGGELVYAHGAAQAYVTGESGTLPVTGAEEASDGDSDSD